MAIQAQVKAVLTDEARDEGGSAMLPIELDAIPGAVWQAELMSLMPPDVRVSLFERGAQKCALLTFPPDHQERAYEAFIQALAGANEVSHQAYLVAAQAREARERSAQ